MSKKKPASNPLRLRMPRRRLLHPPKSLALPLPTAFCPLRLQSLWSGRPPEVGGLAALKEIVDALQ